jgi:hypothetical protein
VADQRPAVPTATKRALRAEAGGKCANPGCAQRRTHLHHIREWAVYQSNDGEHMIALCPTCHDAVHNGALDITDDTLYRWKSIARTDSAKRGHMYVEPAEQATLLLGSGGFSGDRGLIVFAPSEGNRLSFAVEDGDIFLLSLVITDRPGREIARLAKGHVKVDTDAEVEYMQVPGHLSVTVPLSGRYLPNWVLTRVRGNEPDAFQSDDRLKLLDIEVLEPGVVRVAGIWLERYHGVVITGQMLHFVEMVPTLEKSIALAGHGTASTIRYVGPLNEALFQFVEASNAPADGAVRLGDLASL